MTSLGSSLARNTHPPQPILAPRENNVLGVSKSPPVFDETGHARRVVPDDPPSA
jgi:hypothetical protein